MAICRSLVSLAFLAALAGWTQTLPAATPVSTKSSHAQEANSAVHKTDAQILQDILARVSHSKIAVEHFTFHVHGGVATIEGKTSVIQRKGAATRIAHTAGATGVNNLIQISEAARQKAAANFARGHSGNQSEIQTGHVGAISGQPSTISGKSKGKVSQGSATDSDADQEEPLQRAQLVVTVPKK